MGFYSVVEVFPPMFPFREGDAAPIALDEKVERFVEDVRGAPGDLFLVANVKNPELLKLSPVEAAFILQDRLRVRAAPALVVRDMNRLQFLSTVVTAISFELDSLLVAWGDSYPASAKTTNVRDYSSLGRALHEVNSIKRQTHSQVRLLAPVDLNRLHSPRGRALAEERLRAGARYLLAQPPTTDADEVFDAHSGLLKKTGMSDRILLNVFPFRDERDVAECERNFGWRLSKKLHRTAAAGGDSLVRSEREVVRRLREEGYPGVYLSTRGAPSIASKLLL